MSETKEKEITKEQAEKENGAADIDSIDEVNFHYDGDRITVDEVIAIEEGSMRALRDVLAGLLRIDGRKDFLIDTDPEKARALIGKLTITQLRAQADVLANVLQGSVPKDNGTR